MSANTTFSRNFLTSFADLLTLLLCFFILIYEQKHTTGGSHTEQYQEVTKKEALKPIQKNGTTFADRYVSKGSSVKSKSGISVVSPVVISAAKQERLKKRFSLWQRVEGSKPHLKGKALLLESCDKDASVALLKMAEELHATLSYAPTEDCMQKATLLMRR